MKRQKNVEHLAQLGFKPEQIEHLRQLSCVYAEKELILTELRRLEFARWLVSTGRITEKLPKVNML